MRKNEQLSVNLQENSYIIESMIIRVKFMKGRQ